MTFLLLLLASCLAPGQDWPELRGPAQDGAMRERVDWPERFDLRVVWQRDLGSGYSGVVIAGGLVVGTFADGTNDDVVALDERSGAERWRVLLGPMQPGQQGSEDGPTSTPCIAAGRVFAPGPRGRLVALRLEDGEELWSVDLVARFGARLAVYGFGASPVAVGEVVYLPVATRFGIAGIAFDRETGEVRWTHTAGWVDYQNSIRFAEEEGLLLASDASNVTLIDAASGDALMTTSHLEGESDLAYPQIVPVGAERLLFTFESGAILRSLDPVAENLREHWSSRELKKCYSPPVVHGDAVYGLSGTFLVCVDLETGARLWKSREPGARGLILVGGHLALFASDGDVVVAAAARSGYVEEARLSVADRGGYTAPSFANGRLFVRNTAGLACVEVVPRDDREEPASAVAAAVDVEALPRELGELLGQDEALLDAWWDDRELPLIEAGVAHFLYRGEAADVALLGDMTRDRSQPDALRRVPGTDLFHRSYEVDPRGLWQYFFLVDLERAVTDPKNPRTRPALAAINGNPKALGFSPPENESLLVMPGWERPDFLEGAPAGDGGSVERLPYTSEVLRASRELTVYLPAGYDDVDETFPVLYVTGGDHWFEHGELKAALDGLMRARCAPAIVVGLPFHVGSADRMGGYQYARAILDEVAPLVSERYRTGSVEVALGAADDAMGVLALAALGAERFRRVALLSPFADPEDFRLLQRADDLPEAAYVEWSAFESCVTDENTDYADAAARIATLLRERGCEVAGGEVVQGPGFASWSARLDRVLELLLPRE